MSVCTNNCNSTAHGTDNVQCTHPGFVSADVPFIASFSMATVMGYPGESWLHMGQNCLTWGQEGTGWTVRKTRFESRQEQETYLFPTPFGMLLNSYKCYLSGEQSRRRREADHSLPSSAEIRNAWIYTSLLHVVDRTVLPSHCNYFDLSTYARHLRGPPLVTAPG